MINGRSYGWADISVNIMGIKLFGITAINYKDAREMENVYGAGHKPVARGYGNTTYEGSVTLHTEEIAALEAASPTGRLQDIPEFTVVVSYLPDTGVIKTEKLKHVRFMENSRDWKQGDTKSEIELPLIVGDIHWR